MSAAWPIGVPALASPPAVAAAASGQTWQAQLQRAQAAGWFHRADALAMPDANAAHVAADPDAQRQRAAGGGLALASPRSAAAMAAPPLAAARWLAAAGPGASAVPPLSQAPRPAGAVQGAWVPGAPAAPPDFAPMPAAAHRACAASSPPLPLPLPGSRAHGLPLPLRPAAPAVLRLHLEESSGAVHAWIGLDASGAQTRARAAPLLAELRQRLQGLGLRLASLTCNGSLVYREPQEP